MNKDDKDPTSGEGDHLSARRYDRHVREFIAEGKVPDAAQDARAYVETHPEDAEKSERKAQRGPHKSSFVSLDEILAKGRSVIDRVRPLVDRAANKLRHRFSK
ncbi:MAG: hypothetical protein JWO36_584 [Myxococcales bacterium]|nr:hypothetical protein [Myxococcales bacterium]